MDGEATENDAVTVRVGEQDSLPSGGRRERTGPLPVASDRYVIRKLIARGGMGEVHLAWDRELQREVVFKTVRLDLDDESLVPRFVFEARLSGQLEHPNIVPVHDFGTTPDGRPFYTMRWIRGRSLAQLSADGTLPSAVERLDVFRKICDAIAFAHAQGVLHRDLKPGNVMVGEFGEVLVLDWGIARVAGTPSDGSERHSPADRLSEELFDTPHTRGGLVVGTPVFMAPEILAGKRDGLDARIDVYSLGVMLYKLLTDALPFAGERALHDAKAGRFVSPRRRTGAVDRELDAITCKAMARDPADRYASAEELRRDVQAYLEGSDIVAYPRSMLGRALRWAHHNRRIVGPVVMTVALAAVVLFIIGVFYARALRTSRDQAVVAEQVAHVQAARAETASARTWTEAGQFEEAQAALRRARTALTDDDDTAFVDLTEAYLLHEWAPPMLSWSLGYRGHNEFTVALADDGSQLAFRTPDGHIRVIALPDGATTVDKDVGATATMPFGFVDGRVAYAAAEPGRIVLTDLASGHVLATVSGDAPAIVAIRADGRFIEVLDGAVRKLLDSRSGETLEWPLPADARVETISRDGRFASGHRAQHNRIPDAYYVWDMSSGQVLHTFAEARRLTVDPSGDLFVVVTKTRTELWRRNASAQVRHWPELDPVVTLFSPDGKDVLFDHGDGQLSMWSLPLGEPVSQQRLRAHPHGLTNAGDLLVSDRSGWSLLARPSPDAGRFFLDGDPQLSASTADGLLVCIASRDGRVRVLEPWTGAVLRTFQGAAAPVGSRGCAFSPEVTRLAQADRDGVLRIWSLDDDSMVREIVGNELVYAAHFLDENRVLAGFVGGNIGIWDLETGEQITNFEGGPSSPWGLALSRDGRSVFAGGRREGDPIATLWPSEGGPARLQVQEPLIGYGAVFSPDARTMVVGTHTGAAAWWSTQTGAKVEGRARYDGPVISVAISEDGTLVFGSSELGTLDVWHARDGSDVASIPLFSKGLGDVLALPGTNTLMTQGGNSEVRLFDLDRPRKVAASTPKQVDNSFALPSPGQRALGLGHLASMRGDWSSAALAFAKATQGGVSPGRVEWARAAWASGDHATARRLLAQAAAAGEIIAGSARLWASAPATPSGQ